MQRFATSNSKNAMQCSKRTHKMLVKMQLNKILTLAFKIKMAI